jgi:hypothetical protein
VLMEMMTAALWGYWSAGSRGCLTAFHWAASLAEPKAEWTAGRWADLTG